MGKKFEYEGWDAWGGLLSSLTYLLTHPKYGLLLYALIVGGGYGGITEYIEHTTGIRIEMGKEIEAVDVPASKPIGEIYIDGLFMLAQDRQQHTWDAPNAIRVDGKFLGFYDVDFNVWKVADEDALIIYSRQSKRAMRWPVGHGLFDLDNYTSKK